VQWCSIGAVEITQLPSEGFRGVDTFSVAVIEGAESFSALVEGFRRVEAEHRARGRCFVTLDSVNQCLYTSGHARDTHGLDSGVDYPEDDTREALVVYDAALFEVGRAVLRDSARAVSWESVCGSLVVTPDDDVAALVAMNREPGCVIDSHHVVQCLPTDDGADLLANIPNGYFAGDLNPFQCHAVARRLSERHGYVLWGIGASALGFLSVVDSGERDRDALVADLQELYGDKDSASWAGLVPLLRESSVLLLGYTEDFAEVVE
jgi:hypothetical protein